MINNFTLKIIACVAMFIDHFALALWNFHFSAPWFNYQLMRGIGRIAFVIFAFMIANGAFYTKSKPKYAIRMAIFAIISEVPFDLVLSTRAVSFDRQNVFFTLLAGLACIYMVQWANKKINEKETNIAFKLLAIIVCIAVIGSCLYICQFILLTDYGAYGVLCIVVFGVGNLIKQHYQNNNSEHKHYATKRRIVDAVCCIISVCILFVCDVSEIFAIFALIPILLYNYKLGPYNKAIKIAFYTFYPAHLLAAFFIAAAMAGLL